MATIIRAASVVAAAVTPIRRLLADQVEVIWFAWRVFEIAPVASWLGDAWPPVVAGGTFRDC